VASARVLAAESVIVLTAGVPQLSREAVIIDGAAQIHLDSDAKLEAAADIVCFIWKSGIRRDLIGGGCAPPISRNADAELHAGRQCSYCGEELLLGGALAICHGRVQVDWNAPAVLERETIMELSSRMVLIGCKFEIVRSPTQIDCGTFTIFKTETIVKLAVGIILIRGKLEIVRSRS
jgi:hypothetical protein